LFFVHSGPKMSVHIYVASRYRTVPVMRSVHRVLLKQMRLRGTEAANAEVWIAQIVVQCVPDGRTNHGECMTAVCVEPQFLARPVGGSCPNEGAE